MAATLKIERIPESMWAWLACGYRGPRHRGGGGGSTPAAGTSLLLLEILRRRSIGTNRWGYYFREVDVDFDAGTRAATSGGLSSAGAVGALTSQPATNPAGAVISSPIPGSVLEANVDDEIDFSWDAVAGGTAYELDLGSTQGGSDYHNGSSGAGTSATVALASLPGDGSVVWARLTSTVSGSPVINDFKFYDAASLRHLLGNTREVGNVAGGDGVQGNDIDERSASFPPTFVLMPIGGPLWPPPDGELWTVVSHPTIVPAWQDADGRFVCAEPNEYDGPCSGSDVARVWDPVGAAQLTAPTPGSSLAAGYHDFEWDAISGAIGYYLTVGTTLHGVDVFDDAVSGGVEENINLYGPKMYADLYTYMPTPPFTRLNSYEWNVT